MPDHGPIFHHVSVPVSARPFTEHPSESHWNTAISTARLSPERSLHSCQRLLVLDQAAQADVVHHILHLLDPVLDPIASLPQRVVLEVQDLEPGVDVLDELRNL